MKAREQVFASMITNIRRLYLALALGIQLATTSVVYATLNPEKDSVKEVQNLSSLCFQTRNQTSSLNLKLNSNCPQSYDPPDHGGPGRTGGSGTR